MRYASFKKPSIASKDTFPVTGDALRCCSSLLNSEVTSTADDSVEDVSDMITKSMGALASEFCAFV
jgi:hypothetical protein